MKRLCLIILLASTRWLTAQTNAPDGRTDIHADQGYFDMDHYRTVYEGHVRVDNPEMKLTCAWLAADLPHNNNSGRHILALTNVVIDLDGGRDRSTNLVSGLPNDQEQKWHVTSDQAVYDYHVAGTVTNATVTINGHARAESDKVTVTGEPLIWNLGTRQFSGNDYTTIIKGDNLSPGGTNASPTSTHP
jgi:lipopolysaccharide export system protein LptA